jgi:hypothetical protein
MVLRAYEIDRCKTDVEALERILDFANDINFFVPVLDYGHMFSGNAYIYFFNEPNTWDGPWEGRATHDLDVVYLFQNYNEFLSETQKEIAVTCAKDLITFVNGKSPWPAFRWEVGDLYSRIYGSSDPELKQKIETLKTPTPRNERRYTMVTLSADISHDELHKVWTLFMAEN